MLDNCEQVIESCANFVEALIAQSEHVRVLATSRRPLGVSYERLWRIGGLRSTTVRPDGDAAINLFAERARQATADFSLVADAHLHATRSICTLLDGMPLAIELAAARVPLVGLVPMASVSVRTPRSCARRDAASRSATAHLKRPWTGAMRCCHIPSASCSGGWAC